MSLDQNELVKTEFARVMGKRQGGHRGGGGGHRDKRSRGGGGGGRGGGNAGTGWDARSTWPAAEKTSPGMESYYQMQEIVPDDQWLDFMASCRKPIYYFHHLLSLVFEEFPKKSPAVG